MCLTDVPGQRGHLLDHAPGLFIVSQLCLKLRPLLGVQLTQCISGEPGLVQFASREVFVVGVHNRISLWLS